MAKSEKQSADSPDQIEAIPEFDKAMRGIAGTPKEEVDKAEEGEQKNGKQENR